MQNVCRPPLQASYLPCTSGNQSIACVDISTALRLCAQWGYKYPSARRHILRQGIRKEEAAVPCGHGKGSV